MDTSLQTLRERMPELEIDTSADACSAFIRDASGFEGERPLGVVTPRSRDEVQQLVLCARETGVRLLPVSSRGPRYRGDTLCTHDTLVVDLGGLDRIVRVDRRNRVALFEPGVGFPELQAALAERGLRAMLPLAPRPGKSALAAYLEREPTIYPRFQWDLSDPLLCVEVVFGTGEHFRTGSAAGPGTLEEQWRAGDAQKSPMGPGQSDLMRVVQGAQGTIGLVTWCSAKAEVLPSRETLHLVHGDALASLVPFTYELLRRGHADICFLVNGRALTALLAESRDAFAGAVARAAPWYAVYSLADHPYFPDERRRYVRAEIEAELRRAGLGETLSLPLGDPARLRQRLLRPESAESFPYWKHAGLEATRELFFHTTLDRAPSFLDVVERSAAGRAGEPPLLYLQPQLGGRVLHFEIDLPHAEDERAAAADRWWRLAQDLRDAGAFFSRPYGPLAELAFRGSSTAWMVPRIKKIFDPDGVLSPRDLVVPRTAAA